MTSIVLAADATYLPYVPCNLAQIARFGGRADGVVLVVPAGADKELVGLARSAAQARRLELEVVTISALEPLHDRGVISDFRYISYFTYSKLLFAEVLGELDDVLYLDVDTLIRAPLDDLLAWELHHPVGAVQDWVGGVHLFGTPGRPYFNAGVLRLSLARMRVERTWDQAQRIFETRDLKIVDQDVFNLIFGDRFDCLPPTFNVFDSLTRFRIPALRDPVIVHFAGAKKPWHRTTTSQFAREWRREYSENVDRVSQDQVAPRSGPSAYGQSRQAGNGRLGSVVRAALPARAKVAARRAADAVTDRALCSLEEIKAALDGQPTPPSIYPVSAATVEIEDKEVQGHDGCLDMGLDLLVSIARSGTNALGSAIQRSRPQVHWLNELYFGLPDGLRKGELLDRFPWFADGDPASRAKMSPRSRHAAARSFSVAMSENAVAVTHCVLESRPGRTLIKVFPDQLDPSRFEEVLRTFRPRLLILRRELVFSYISRLRAIRTGAWRDADLTDVSFNMTDKAAMHYAVHADGWFDYVTRLAENLRLESVGLTYSGLFENGSEIPVLESFYPGPEMDVDECGRLRAGLEIQDRRSDASVLNVLNAVSRLSSLTQSRLLRLPGNLV